VRLSVALVVAGVSLLLVGTTGGAPPRPLILGVSWEGSGQLGWMDARTLAPGGRRVDIGPPPKGVAARSPDGRTIALGSGTAVELRFVDVRAMRASGRLLVRGAGFLLDAIWPRPNRMIALRSGEEAEILVVDPSAHRVLERQPLEGHVVSVAPAGKRLVALLAPKGTIGEARLMVVGVGGGIRTMPLPQVSAGFTPPRTEQDAGRQASPGLAVNPRGTRAVIVTPDTLFEVDLDGLAVTRHHRLAARTPASVHKVIEGWGRRVVWLGEDAAAVFGWTDSIEGDGDQSTHATTGVEFIDVTSGAQRSLDSTATGAMRVRDVLLTFGGSALRGYDLAGKLRFELLRGQDTGYVQQARRWIYVGRDNSTKFTIVDAQAGRVVGTARTPSPIIVLGS